MALQVEIRQVDTDIKGKWWWPYSWNWTGLSNRILVHNVHVETLTSFELNCEKCSIGKGHVESKH